MELDRQLFELCEPVLERSGYELVWVQVTGAGGTRKRVGVYIDKEGGVDVEDCAAVSRLLDPLIEDNDVIKSAWVLEVSSPGLDRPLYKPADFDRFAGSKARVMLKRPIDDASKQRNYTGVLRGLEDGAILLDTESGQVSLPLENLHRANLVFEWK